MDTTTSQPSVSPHPANIDQPVTIRPNAPGSRIPTGILDFFLALESSSATVPAGPGPSRLNTAPASEIARSEAVAPQLRSKVTISLASDADGASEEFSDLIDSGALNDVAVGVAAHPRWRERYQGEEGFAVRLIRASDRFPGALKAADTTGIGTRQTGIPIPQGVGILAPCGEIVKKVADREYRGVEVRRVEK